MSLPPVYDEICPGLMPAIQSAHALFRNAQELIRDGKADSVDVAALEESASKARSLFQNMENNLHRFDKAQSVYANGLIGAAPIEIIDGLFQKIKTSVAKSMLYTVMLDSLNEQP